MSKYDEVFEKWFEENSKCFVGKSAKGAMKEAFVLGMKTRKQMEHGNAYGFSGPKNDTMDSIMYGLYAAKEETEKPNTKFFYVDTECGINMDRIRKIADEIQNEGFSEGGRVPKSPFPLIDYSSVIHPFKFTKKDMDSMEKYLEKLGKSFGYKKKEETPKSDTKRFRYRYIKRNNKIVGIMIAWKQRGLNVFGVGYSICDPRDEFNWETAIRLAFDRMFFDPDLPEVPKHIKDQFHSFVYESRHKFKCPYVSIPNVKKDYNSFFACLPEYFKKKMKESPAPAVEDRKENIKEEPRVRYFRSYHIGKDGISVDDEVRGDAPGMKLKVTFEVVDKLCE